MTTHPRWWPQEGDEPDPRWSLANERTLLAYTRTALAFIVAGVAMAGSRSVADAPRWFASLGLPFIAIGTFITIAGRRRFVETQRAMRTGEELPVPLIAARLPWALAALGALTIVVAGVQLFVD